MLDKLADLKPFIEIDISKLENVGQTINVDDITLPKGMSLINDEQAKAIVTITEIQKVEEVVVTPAEGEEVEGEESAEGEEVVEGEEATEATTDQTKKE